jgi:hypothetical protein
MEEAEEAKEENWKPEVDGAALARRDAALAM